MADCVYCMIVNGELPSTRLYEDEDILVFKDINPQAPTHFLVIPKKHELTSSADVTPENSAIIARCFEVIAMLAKREGLTNGYRVITNSGSDAGQTVFHLHFHVLAGKPLGEHLV